MNAKRKIVLVILTAFCMIFGVMGLTGCDDGTIEAPTNIRYDGSKITWDKVEGATGYVVQINGGNANNWGSNSFTYDAQGSEIVVKVKAVSKGERKTIESEEAVMNFMPLPTITDLKVSETGVVSWTAQSGCVYSVMDNDVELNTTLATNKIETHAVGEHSYKVRPVIPNENAYYSYWSDSISVNQLGVVDGESITYDGSYIYFDTIGANKYDIYINDQLNNENVEVKNGKYLYDAREGNFKVRIQAIGDHLTSFDGAKSDEKTFKFLQQVKDIKVVNGGITWEEIGDANGYEVKIKKGLTENVYTTTETEFNDETVLTSSVNIDVSVRAIADDATFFSKFSDIVPIYFLPAPVITWDELTSLDGGENSIMWNEVDSATGYYVTVIDPEGNSTGEQLSYNAQNYANLYEKVGVYKVSVVALADEENDNIYSSRPSNEIRVNRIAPASKCTDSDSFVTSKATDVTDGFTVSCYDEHISCKYALYKNGTQIAESNNPQIKVPYANFFEQSYITGQVITFEIKRMGAGVTYNGTQTNVMLNSRDDDNLAFDITILSTPQNVYMDGYMIKYDSVPNATDGYGININGSALAITEDTTTRDISNSIDLGAYNVQVCAKGNGKNVLPSNYSAPIAIVRLDAPVIERIDMNESGGRLVFSEPLLGNAEGYKLVLNEVEQDSVLYAIDNMNGKISTEGTDVKIKAVANYYENKSSKTGTYYMTSKASASRRFVKLQKPTDLSFDNNSLSWNMTGISTSQLGMISYLVYDDMKETTISEPVSIKTINFDFVPKFVGGRDYQFKVQAIGDGITFINSEVSTAKQVYKLATPEVKKDNATGEYYWKGVSQASSYVVTIDGIVVKTLPHTSASEEYRFDPVSFLDDLGTYNVEVTAVGNKAIGQNPTINSQKFTIEQSVVQLAVPEFGVGYTHAQYNREGKIIVTVTGETPNASGYKYVIGGNTSSEEENGGTTYELNPNATGRFAVDVYAKGGTFDENGAFTLDSASKGTKYITLLGTVNIDNITLNDWMIKWTTVENASKYRVEISYNGSSEYELLYEGAQLSCVIQDTSADTVQVKITALGNNSNVIDGEVVTSRIFENLQE